MSREEERNIDLLPSNLWFVFPKLELSQLCLGALSTTFIENCVEKMGYTSYRTPHPHV
jgi:hypothetical protein